MKKLIFTIIILTVISLQINAQTATPGINKTQKNQQARIQQGIKGGELTKVEARKLELQQAKIQKDKLVAKSDGVVTKKERKHIKKEQMLASKNIYRKKHNNRSKI